MQTANSNCPIHPVEVLQLAPMPGPAFTRSVAAGELNAQLADSSAADPSSTRILPPTWQRIIWLPIHDRATQCQQNRQL